MVGLILPVKRGLSSPAVTSIPQAWDKQWFRLFIDNFLTNADIRNVVAAGGIAISGSNVSGNSDPGTPPTPGGTVTISQAPIPNNTVLGNVSGIVAVPSAISATQLTTLINVFTATLAGDVPASGGGAINFLRADGTWVVPAGSAAIPNNTVLGNISGGTATPVALTQTQLTALVNVFTSALSGAVPASGGGITTFLRADGTFNVPPNFTAIAPGYVPLSGGGTANFLRADGTFAVPAQPTGANPTASVGLAAVNGVATTFMRSDGAPALSVAIVPTWSGVHTFSARPAFNAGATVAGGTFISRGISDSATATALTLAGTGALTIAAPSSTNNALTINGATSAISLVVVSALGAAAQGADISVQRTGSTVNTIGKGPNLTLADNTATTSTMIQHSGGQFEIWQTQNNGVSWNQAMSILPSNGVVINTPISSAFALLVNGLNNSFTSKFQAGTTANQSFGLDIDAGTSTSDTSFQIRNAAGATTYFRVRGDGETFVAPNGVLLNTLAALTNNGAASSPTLGAAGPAGATTPTKWIKINDNGTIRSIPAW